MTRILEHCYGCTEPIYDGDSHQWRIPYRGSEWEEPFHDECVPSTFFIEENEVLGLGRVDD